MFAKKSSAFSLVEIVLAMGVCTFIIVALVGLFGVGLKARRDSLNQCQAADLATHLIATRAAFPNVESVSSGSWAIPAAAMVQRYGNAYPTATAYVGADGKLTDSTKAVYSICCYSGTTVATGPRVAKVYFVLSWPPGASQANAEGRYETVTYISLY